MSIVMHGQTLGTRPTEDGGPVLTPEGHPQAKVCWSPQAEVLHSTHHDGRVM